MNKYTGRITATQIPDLSAVDTPQARAVMKHLLANPVYETGNVIRLLTKAYGKAPKENVGYLIPVAPILGKKAPELIALTQAIAAVSSLRPPSAHMGEWVLSVEGRARHIDHTSLRIAGTVIDFYKQSKDDAIRGFAEKLETAILQAEIGPNIGR